MLGELRHQQRAQRRQTGRRARLAQPLEQPAAAPRNMVSAHAMFLGLALPALAPGGANFVRRVRRV
jgi:hypothetical protein